MNGPIDRKPRVRTLPPTEPDFRHWIDVTIGFSMPGDTIVLHDDESYRYTINRLKQHPRAGVIVRGPGGVMTSTGVTIRPQDRDD